MTDCQCCNGTGNCPECRGLRYVDDGPHGAMQCPVCMGDGLCDACDGTGEKGDNGLVYQL